MLKKLPVENIVPPVVTPVGESGWFEVVLGKPSPESVQAVESLNTNRKFAYGLTRECIYGYALKEDELADYAHTDRLSVALRAITVKDDQLAIKIKPVGIRAKAVYETIVGGTASYEVLVDSRSKADVTSATSAIVVIRSDSLSAEFK